MCIAQQLPALPAIERSFHVFTYLQAINQAQQAQCDVEEAAAIKQLELSSRLEELAAENAALRDSLKEANASNLDLKGQLEVQAKQVGRPSW
jgi:hypothetical protein